MSRDSHLLFSLHETCDALGLEREYLIEIVETGMVEPQGEAPEQWHFDASSLNQLRRACRLAHELHLDWSATAMLNELLEDRERLQQENRQLRRQLERFIRIED